MVQLVIHLCMQGNHETPNTAKTTFSSKNKKKHTTLQNHYTKMTKPTFYCAYKYSLYPTHTTPQYKATMRLSCNGCRILRKGCSDDCTIRPCLEWINSPESQANATLFLAKFYGRAGLLNLINAAPPQHRPAVFKSLMYEACGRIANPAYGSLGLFWTGDWARCQAAVDAVLIGSEINAMEPSVWQLTGTRGSEHVFQAHGIRHLSRDTDMDQLKGRARFKRTGNVIRPKARVGSVDSSALWKTVSGDEPGNKGGCVSSGSDETVEASLMNQNRMGEAEAEADVDLELTLG